MKKKDYIFCLLSNNSNSIKIFNIYKNYIESVINRYGKFVIVDFYRYSQKNNKKIINEKLLKKKFKNEIHFFYPKNKYELICSAIFEW